MAALYQSLWKSSELRGQSLVSTLNGKRTNGLPRSSTRFAMCFHSRPSRQWAPGQPRAREAVGYVMIVAEASRHTGPTQTARAPAMALPRTTSLARAVGSSKCCVACLTSRKPPAAM